MRVLLADDHKMMRDGLRSVLESADVDVVGEAANGNELIALAKRLVPDFVLMDLGMPELNGIQATARLRVEVPSVKVVAISMHAEAQYVQAALAAGAAGYVVKNAAANQLLAALTAVGRGETYLWLGASHESVVASPAPAPRSIPDAPVPLSSREREVLRLVADGKSSKEIASLLGIAVPTVESHRRQIMRKLDLRTIAELTKYAIRAGLSSVGG